MHDAQIDGTLPRRAANIAAHRHSKAGAHGHQASYLLLKAPANGVCWQSRHQPDLDLSHATRAYGAASLRVGSEDDWHSPQPLWLIENQALFDHSDWLPADIGGSLCWYAGQLTNRVIDWLAASPRSPRLIIFPDYDGVGLLNYARLRERDIPCDFWLMPDWPERLQRFGNVEIWQDTQTEFHAALSRLQQTSLPPSLKVLIDTLQQLGLALEQESLWL
jgi:hypothetical protein